MLHRRYFAPLKTRARWTFVYAALLLSLLAVARSAHATTFTVTNVKDTGLGSLRNAIALANSTPGTDIVAFAIPGRGVHTIRPASPLPTIAAALTVDGYTQPGATPNTLAEGNDAQILIRIDGGNTGATTTGALAVCADDTTIRGLAITNFNRHGIVFGQQNTFFACAGGGVTGGTIAGNYIGIAPDGVTAAPNAFQGIVIDASTVRVGSGALADRNVISASGNVGVLLRNGATGSTIDGNYIGTDASGRLDRGNAGAGIALTGAGTGNVVGENAPNRIAHNSQGILISSAVVGATIRDNEIYANDSVGIDLAASGNTPDGVTPNDADDVDGGANGLLNFPLITAVSRTANGLHVVGTLDRGPGAAAQNFGIRLYGADACEASGHGPARRTIGAAAISITGTSEAFAFDVATSAQLPVGSVIVATTSDVNGNTSEFSACVPIDPNAVTYTVTSTNDNGPNSLRQAILDANAHVGGDVVAFNIPGSGVATIALLGSLPSVNQALRIDGYTQPGSAPNTLAVGDDAVLRVRLDGSGAAANSEAFAVCGDDVLIRGLSITGFGTGIALGTDGASLCSSPNNATVIVGNFIGLAPDGSAAGNRSRGISNSFTGNVRVGGPAPAERNVIAANGPLSPIGAAQIALVNGATAGTRMVNNYIGTDPSGTLGRGSGGDALRIGLNVSNVQVGAPDAGNVIAFVANGIVVESGILGLDFRDNEMFSNSGIGVDLVASGGFPDGVTPNDVDDADTGANGLQNFPSVTSATIEYGRLRLTGSLDVQTNVVAKIFRIDAYANAACDFGGFGEGRAYLGSRNVVLSNTAEALSLDVAAAPPLGSVITFTATGQLGTSEFSACKVLTAGDGLFADDFGD